MLIRSSRFARSNFRFDGLGHCGVTAILLCKNAVRYRLSKAKHNGYHCYVAKTILLWSICVFALTMTGFGGIFITFNASSSFDLVRTLVTSHLLIKFAPATLNDRSLTVYEKNPNI